MKKIILITIIILALSVGLLLAKPFIVKFIMMKKIESMTSLRETKLTPEDILDQNWIRLAVKKNKKGAYLPEVTAELTGQYFLGLIDKSVYENLSRNHDMTFAEANEQFYDDYITSPDVAILGTGYALSMSDLLQKKFNEPIRRFTVKDFTPDAIKDYPIFIIPSSGLEMVESSNDFRASLATYVKKGGTLIVFAQPRGHLFSAVPTPQEADGTYNKIGGYGWIEDQSENVNAAYIDTYHQILSGQNMNTLNVQVDGYLNSYPSNSKILLRKTSSGQPVMIMYPYGDGNIVVTTLYTDYALTRLKVSNTEVTLIRDIIHWFKRPTNLPEIKPGEKIRMEVSATNFGKNKAQLVKFYIYNPERTKLLKTKLVLTSIAAGEKALVPISFTPPTSATLGIYHIDYELFDWKFNNLQMQAETDSGRFIVSNPPTKFKPTTPLTSAVHSNDEYYPADSLAEFTVVAYNNSEVEKAITAKYDNRIKTLTLPPKKSNSFTYSKRVTQSGWERVTLYDSEDKQISNSAKGYWVYNVNIAIQADKHFYKRGDKVSFKLNFQNRLNEKIETTLKIYVTNLSSSNIYSVSEAILLPERGVVNQNQSFVLPENATSDLYIINVDAFNKVGSKIGWTSCNFEVQ